MVVFGVSMAFYVDIKVVPSSKKQGFVFDKSGVLKCHLKSPPEKGKANAELVALIAKRLKIPKNDVSIVLGQTSRKKRIKIMQDIDFERFLEMVGLERQLTI